MKPLSRSIAVLVLLGISTVSAAESDQMTQQIFQESAFGRFVRSVTADPAQPIESSEFAGQWPVDLPILAVGELMWDVADAVGLMDNVAISDDGTLAAVGVSLNNHSLRVFDGITGIMNYEVSGVDGLSAVAVSPSGSHVVWAQSHVVRAYPGGEGVEIWSREIPNEQFFGGIALSHDGQQVAILETHSSDSLHLGLYSTTTGVPIWERNVPMMALNNHWVGVRITADGSRVVATTRFRIFVLDATDGELIWNADGRNTEHPASVSGDGRVIASGSNNTGKIHVYMWDEANSTYISFWDYRFSGGTSNWGTATAVSANGETIAGGSLQFNGGGNEGYVAVFETNGGGVPLWVSDGMGDLVGGIEVSDDGLTLAACSWGYLNDGQPDIRVFQKYNSTPFFTYTHPGSPNDLDISADGTHLIAGGKAVHNRFFGNGGHAYVFSLDLEGGSVSGSVTLQGTQDYSGVTVEAEGTHLHATTSTNGSYRIDHIPAGTYTLTARKLGYTYGSVSGVVVTEDGLTTGVNFALSETEAAPQNLAAISGLLRSIDLTWSALGSTTRSNRELEALWAVGDISESPSTLPPTLQTAQRLSEPPSSDNRGPRARTLDDPDSIHIWRAPLAGGPYSLIASVVGTATTYGDSIRVYPGSTYYYVVTAVYGNGESEYSNEVSGALDDSYLIYDPVVPPATTPVVFDGVLSPNEWADAVRIDISDVYGYDSPNPPLSAFLYMKYDDTQDLLLLAAEDHLNPTLDDGEGFGIYVDDDDSDSWTYDRQGSEGNYWAYHYSSGPTLRYRSLTGGPFGIDPYHVFQNPQIGFSTSAGYFTGEVAIPMGFHEVYEMALYGPDKTPGVGFFVIQRQAGVAIFDGWWPQNIPSIVSNPEYFSNSSIQATLAVPPDSPTNIAIVQETGALRVNWSDPAIGIDGLPVSGLAGLVIYRNGELIDFAPPGAQTYLDETVGFGGWYEYALSGFILENDVEFEGPQSLPVGTYAGGAPDIDWLVYDDGTWEGFMVVSFTYDDNRFAVRCDMPENMVFVYTIQLMVNGIAPVGIGVADDDDGLPGGQQFGPYFITPPVTEEFFTVHIPGEGPPAPVGTFWTTLDWTPERPGEPGIATDFSGNQGRSYWHQGATGWTNQPSNFMVRTGVGDFINDAEPPYEGVVKENGLSSNYPNPFNPETTIPFMLARTGEATVIVYNVAGQKVATLVSGKQPAGHHLVRWNGRSDQGLALASGVYFARLEANGFAQTRKMMLLR